MPRRPRRSGPGGATPVITVGVGDPQIRYDREVRSVTAGPSAMDASLVDITATIVGHGATGRSQVRLLQGNRVLEVRDVTPARRRRAGAAGVPGAARARCARGLPRRCRRRRRELTAENNKVDVLVPAPGRPRRILFVEGAPGFEHTFLRRAWQLDPSLEIDSVVRKGRDDQGQDTYYVQAASARTAALSPPAFLRRARRSTPMTRSSWRMQTSTPVARRAGAARGFRRRARRRPAGAWRARAVAAGARTVHARARAAGGSDRPARRPRAGGAARRPTASRSRSPRKAFATRSLGWARPMPRRAAAGWHCRRSAGPRRSARRGPAPRCSRPPRAARGAPCRSSPCSASAAAAR